MTTKRPEQRRSQRDQLDQYKADSERLRDWMLVAGLDPDNLPPPKTLAIVPWQDYRDAISAYAQKVTEISKRGMDGFANRVIPFAMAVANLNTFMGYLTGLVANEHKPTEAVRALKNAEPDGATPSLLAKAGIVKQRFKVMSPEGDQEKELGSLMVQVNGLNDRVDDLISAVENHREKESKDCLKDLQEYCGEIFGREVTELAAIARASAPSRSRTAWYVDIQKRATEYHTKRPGATPRRIYAMLIEAYTAEDREGRLSDVGREAWKHIENWEERRWTNYIKKAVTEYAGSW